MIRKDTSLLLLSICNWYCLNVHNCRYSIPANQCWIWINTLHFLPPRAITHFTTWTKQWFVFCYKIECMLLDLLLMLPGLCYLDSNWNTIIHFNMPSRCNSWDRCWSCSWCDSCGGLCWNNNNSMEVQAINLLLCNYSLNLGPSTLLYLHHTD